MIRPPWSPRPMPSTNPATGSGLHHHGSLLPRAPATPTTSRPASAVSRPRKNAGPSTLPPAAMRRLLVMLRDVDDASRTTAPQPGLGQLDGLAGQFREAGLPVTVTVEGQVVALAAGLDLSAYRVIQEGLTNALKHGGGAPASVRLRYGARHLEVDVTD